MKRFRVFSVMLVVLLAFSMAFIACGSDDGSNSTPGGNNGGTGNAQQLNATPENFDEVLRSVSERRGNYVINLTGDLLDYHGFGLNTAGVNITVKGTGSNRITWKYEQDNPPLFYVENGKLTLENINLSYSPSNTQNWPLLIVSGGTIEIKDGVNITGEGDKFNGGVNVDSGSFIMSGGIIQNCSFGVGANNDGASITISGGIIRNSTGFGIGLWEESKNITLRISGGEISGNKYDGIFVMGTGGHNVNMTGGNISGNGGNGMNLQWEESKNSTLRISGGEIIGNKSGGIALGGTGHNVNMTGGNISGNDGSGMKLQGEGLTFIMSGGSIGGNSDLGLFVEGAANSGFEKRTGAVIYGYEGENANQDGAIHIGTSGAEKHLSRDAASDTVYAARTNASGGVIENSPQGGEWD